MKLSYGVFTKDSRGNYRATTEKTFDTLVELELTEPIPEGMKKWLLIVIIIAAAFVVFALVGCICMKKKAAAKSKIAP
jgi:hypothetical protein